MLVGFTFRNYRSFRDEQTFSMVASSNKLHPESVVDVSAPKGYQSLLRSSVIYGANASGKTNLIKALAFVRDFVLDPRKLADDKGIRIDQFAFANETERSATSVFEILFYRDYLHELHFELTKERVVQESLYTYPKGRRREEYTREWKDEKDGYDYHYGSELRGQKFASEVFTGERELFLTNAARQELGELSKAHDWFRRSLRIWWSDDPDAWNNPFVGQELSANANLRNALVRVLKQADFGIEEILIEGIPIPAHRSSLEAALGEGPEAAKEVARQIDTLLEKLGEALNEGLPDRSGSEDTAATKARSKLRVRFAHQVGDGQTPVPLSLENESAGTLRMMGLAYILSDLDPQGETLVFDEMGRSLHPALLWALIESFNRMQGSQSQLIFNTHDTSVLDQDLFRRDQVWFVEKDRRGASELYPLTEFAPRTSDSLGKRYLQGRYGAIPYIGDLGLVCQTSEDGEEDSGAHGS